MIKYKYHYITAGIVVWCFSAIASGEKNAVTPENALTLLVEGNTRYVSGKSLFDRQNQEWRTMTATHGQHPYASILSCSDSRVPVEILFDAGIGEIFVVRVAGNVADVDEIGSLEYGVGHLKTPVLMVLGHTKCGAVTAVVKNDKVGGSIPLLVDNIIPAANKAVKNNPNAPLDSLVPKAILLNIRQSIEDIFNHSEEVRSLVRENKLNVIGALYDIETGKVRFLGNHPNQAKLIDNSGEPSESAGERKPH